ncbi:Pro-Pol polyprotein [Gossypium australe]|uniref:Pro-Pol polyprotein n=1 Tax=Gossypium australe TaxID=47621 RepID=A0A5B6VY73_9ROSI|nr:Pro-Pol polyprotein [Gossypium australe]
MNGNQVVDHLSRLEARLEDDNIQIIKEDFPDEQLRHFGGMRIASKVLQSGFYWPNMFKDAHEFYHACDHCQRMGRLSRRQEMPLQNIVEIELFGLDFMVDYISKWTEVSAFPTNDAKSVMKFLHKNISTRFGTPCTLISDEGSHFDCKFVASALHRYGVKHKIATTYHPQKNDQVEVSNREIKQILEKVVNPTRKDWSSRLDEAL